MLKEIPVSQLRIGMFLHEIDLNPSLFPAIKSQSNISNNSSLRDIQDTGIKVVTIDTEKGHDIYEEGLQNLKRQIEIKKPKKQNRRPIPATPLPELNATTITDELKTAQPLRRLALESINNAFYQVKMGRSIDASEVKQSVTQLTDSIIRNQDALLALGQIRHKNSYMYDHAVNCCVLAITFGKWQKLDYETIITLGTAALLHDIGETLLEDNLIRHKGYLNELEFTEIQKHVDYSVQLLTTNMGINALTVKLVQQHHERLDGSGYPAGLKGPEIDPLAQMLGLIDIYDSMTADTVYSYAIPPTHVLKQLLESNDEMFDGLMIKQFIKCIGIYPVGSLVRLSNGCIAIVNEIIDQDSLHPKVKMIYNARQEHFINPIDLNLADPDDPEKDLSITGCVDPNHFHINLAAFI